MQGGKVTRGRASLGFLGLSLGTSTLLGLAGVHGPRPWVVAAGLLAAVGSFVALSVGDRA